MTYTPKAIANFFLQLADSAGRPITPMKLQKLVYYANGWYAGHTGQQLISEPIEAWQYGPVIPSLYHEFKQFGASPIRSAAREFLPASSSFVVVPPPVDLGIRQFLTNIWNSYESYSGVKLSEMTHANGSPWDLTWKEGQGIRGRDIPASRITEHFKAAVQNSSNVASV